MTPLAGALVALLVVGLLVLAAVVLACEPPRYCPSCGWAGGHAHGCRARLRQAA